MRVDVEVPAAANTFEGSLKGRRGKGGKAVGGTKK